MTPKPWQTISRHALAALGLALAFGASGLACNSSTAVDDPTLDVPRDQKVEHALSQMDSCEAYTTYLKQAAMERLVAGMERQKSAIDSCWRSPGDTDTGAGWEGDTDSGSADMDVDGDGDTGAGDADADGDQGNSHTDTNVQEKGVDEADIVKTDGERFYVLSSDSLVVAGIGDAGLLDEIGRLALTGAPTELFLYKDLVIAFSRLWANQVPESIRIPAPPWSSGQEPGYEPDTETPGDDDDDYAQEYTRISIVDVADPAAPALVRQITYPGSYVTSRRIDGSLRAVISAAIPALSIPLPELGWWNYCSLPEEIGRAMFQAAADAFVVESAKIIEAVTPAEIMPKKIDGNDASPAEPLVACEDVFGPKTPAGTGLLTVVSLDLDQPMAKQTDIATVGDQGLVYASQTSLYLTTNRDYVEQAWWSGIWRDQTSGIHKFDIASSKSRAIYKATGTVTGRMLNQFCLGESDGYLRVATTTGSEDFSTWDNRITVFEEQDGVLVETGHLAGIGKGEEIYAARFLGDRGFLVTFRQTDPLFTFDLSDPRAPKKVGEWQGPGYSTYLHPLGDNHIIAMGQEDWRPAISLYDFTDFANPTLVERIYMDDGTGYGLSSAALYDHKAFTFDSDRGLLALPFEGFFYNEEVGYESFATGIALYNVDGEGFTEIGRLPVIEQNPEYHGYESPAQRSAIVDDVLFGISRCRITSAALAAPEQTLDTLELFTGETCDPDGWDGGGDMDTDVDMDVDGDADADTDWGGDAGPDTDPSAGDSDIDTDTGSETAPSL